MTDPDPTPEAAMPRRGVADSRLRNWARGITRTPPTPEMVAELLAERDVLCRDLAYARPVLAAAGAWVRVCRQRFGRETAGPLASAVVDAFDAYRAALSAPVEAGATEPAPDEREFLACLANASSRAAATLYAIATAGTWRERAAAYFAAQADRFRALAEAGAPAEPRAPAETPTEEETP